MQRPNFSKIFVLSFVVLLVPLSSCGKQWAATSEEKTFLHFKYKLEDCADVHGQDIYSKIWFSEYKGDSYKALMDVDFEKTFLDMNVGINDQGHAYGYGNLALAKNGGGYFVDNLSFTYFGMMMDTTGGYIVSDLSNQYGRFVYCIYWARLNMQFVVPDTEETVTLTLHFRGGINNPYPNEFGPQYTEVS